MSNIDTGIYNVHRWLRGTQLRHGVGPTTQQITKQNTNKIQTEIKPFLSDHLIMLRCMILAASFE